LEQKRAQDGRLSCSFCFLSLWGQADALTIMAVITELLLDTGPVRITEVARTGAVMPLTLAMVQGPSRSRLAIDRIILAVLVITWADPITSGGQDIGDWSTAGESGYTGITS